MNKKTIFLKNPILRQKMDGHFINPVGDLIEEVNEQDLNSQVGGTITVIVTQIRGCGYIFTLSAECSSNGKSCN